MGEPTGTISVDLQCSQPFTLVVSSQMLYRPPGMTKQRNKLAAKSQLPQLVLPFETSALFVSFPQLRHTKAG